MSSTVRQTPCRSQRRADVVTACGSAITLPRRFRRPISSMSSMSGSGA
jgi:hypothetical protein